MTFTLITHGLAALGGAVLGVLFGIHNPTKAAAIAKAAKTAGTGMQSEAQKL